MMMLVMVQVTQDLVLQVVMNATVGKVVEIVVVAVAGLFWRKLVRAVRDSARALARGAGCRVRRILRHNERGDSRRGGKGAPSRSGRAVQQDVPLFPWELAGAIAST
jgi:hypothetical protein